MKYTSILALYFYQKDIFNSFFFYQKWWVTKIIKKKMSFCEIYFPFGTIFLSKDIFNSYFIKISHNWWNTENLIFQSLWMIFFSSWNISRLFKDIHCFFFMLRSIWAYIIIAAYCYSGIEKLGSSMNIVQYSQV